MLTQLNSLRMRAQRNGQHISGAERLLDLNDLATAAAEMLQRALRHPRGAAQQICFHVEPVAADGVTRGRLLNLSNNQVDSWQRGRQLASQFLLKTGIKQTVAEQAIAILANGATPTGQSMRGAMLIDADTGDRLEADQVRGVRASRMDLDAGIRQELCRQLELIHLNNPHVIEALILASKVCSAPGVVAELCWSDDPDYLAGYVASKKLGYQRLSLMKPAGEERGGRAFFVRRSKDQLQQLVIWLETKPLLFDHIGQIYGSAPQSEKS